MNIVEIELPVSEPSIAMPEGDVGEIEKFAADLLRNADRFEEVEANARAALRAPWSGQASAAFRSAVKKEIDIYRSAAEALLRVRKACLIYADTLDDLKTQTVRLEERKAELDVKLGMLHADVAAAKNVPDERIAQLQHRAGVLRADYFELVADHDAVQAKSVENEKDMIAAFAANDTVEEALDGSIADKVAEALSQPGSPMLTGLPFAPPTDPRAVKRWWDGLDPAVQDAVIAAYPGMIGRADGIPAAARDDANRINLQRDLDYLTQKADVSSLSDPEKKALQNAKQAQAALAKADKYRDPLDGSRPGGQLYLYDPYKFNGDGQVAIAVGNLDTADNVAVRVPGITNDMTKTPGLTEEAAYVYQAARYADPNSSVASMIWLGYDAPSGFTDSATRSEARAAEGGELLADDIDGLRASRPDPANLTVIGHSFGSTTVARAAVDTGLDADNIVLVGSPGAGRGVEHAAELGIGAENVYVGRNSEDIVPGFGGHGEGGSNQNLGKDPADYSFGARRFEAEDGRPTLFGMGGIQQHGRHFDWNTESLFNIGHIVANQTDHVNEAPPIEREVTKTVVNGDIVESVGDHDPEADRNPKNEVPGRSKNEAE